MKPENVHYTVRKSAQGQTAEVKVRVSGLTEGKAAKVAQKAKQAARSGRGLPTPEDVEASQREQHREELRQHHFEEQRKIRSPSTASVPRWSSWESSSGNGTRSSLS